MLITRNYCIAILLLLNSFALSQTIVVKETVTLSLKDVSLIEVLKAIEIQNGTSFVYNTTVMKNAQKMSIDVKDFDLKVLLQIICNKSGNNYKVINSQVVFYKVTEPSNKSIRIISASEIHKKQQNQSTQTTIRKSDSYSSYKTNINKTLDSSIKRNYTNQPKLNKIKSIDNVNLTPLLLPKTPNLIHTSDSTVEPIKEGNLITLTKLDDKTASKKFFLSLQTSGYIGISPGFKSNDSLNQENTLSLNKSISSYGYSETLYLGYTYKHFSYKTGIKYTKLNEELSEKKTYNQFSTQTNWQVITWQEQNSDGITVHYDTIPTTQTIVNDSTITTKIKYHYSYIEIPFYIDYTYSINSQWSIFSSLGFTYAIRVKNKASVFSSIYEPSEVNNLNLSGELNLGLIFCTNSLNYYLKAGGIIRSTYAANNNLIKRNPVYTNISIGIINYF